MHVELAVGDDEDRIADEAGVLRPRAVKGTSFECHSEPDTFMDTEAD